MDEILSRGKSLQRESKKAGYEWKVTGSGKWMAAPTRFYHYQVPGRRLSSIRTLNASQLEHAIGGGNSGLYMLLFRLCQLLQL